MPVIRSVPQDPTDLVISGEQFRATAIQDGIHIGNAPVMTSVFFEDDEGYILHQAPVLVADDLSPLTVQITPPREALRNPFAGTMIGSNIGVCTPCGAIYPHGIGAHLMNSFFVQNSARWQIVGVTRDSAGSPLGNCRVVMLEIARIAVNGAPVVGETVSDGSGNYTIEVWGNTAHQGIAYKDGSPDVAGISIDTLTPAQV